MMQSNIITKPGTYKNNVGIAIAYCTISHSDHSLFNWSNVCYFTIDPMWKQNVTQQYTQLYTP